MQINWNAFLESLPIMGYGMAGIFIVLGAAWLMIKGLTVLFPVQKDQEKQ